MHDASNDDPRLVLILSLDEVKIDENNTRLMSI